MSRIDVTKNEDGVYQVLVNYGMDLCQRFKDMVVANGQAQKLHDEKYPDYQLNLLEEDE